MYGPVVNSAALASLGEASTTDWSRVATPAPAAAHAASASVGSLSAHSARSFWTDHIPRGSHAVYAQVTLTTRLPLLPLCRTFIVATSVSCTGILCGALLSPALTTVRSHAALQVSPASVHLKVLALRACIEAPTFRSITCSIMVSDAIFTTR